MDFDLSGKNAYVIEDSEKGCFIYDCQGRIMEANQMLNLSKRLKETAVNASSKEIIEHNENIKPDEWWKSNDEKPKKIQTGFIYMLECGGRYKIGMTNDIDRRIKELDKRPFPVNLISLSEPISDPYKEEQKIHLYLVEHRINGEWYELSQDNAEIVKNYIERLGTS